MTEIKVKPKKTLNDFHAAFFINEVLAREKKFKVRNVIPPDVVACMVVGLYEHGWDRRAVREILDVAFEAKIKNDRNQG